MELAALTLATLLSACSPGDPIGLSEPLGLVEGPPPVEPKPSRPRPRPTEPDDPLVVTTDEMWASFPTTNEAPYLGLFGAVLDLDLDGRDDVVLSDMGNTWLWTDVHEGENRSDEATLLPFLGGSDFEVGDLNGDGHDDLVTLFNPSIFPSEVTVYFAPYPDGQFLALDTEGCASTTGMNVLAADVDEDGMLDLVYYCPRELRVWHGPLEPGSIRYGPRGPIDSTPMLPTAVFEYVGSGLDFMVAAGDVSGDGVSDLVGRPSYQVRLMEGPFKREDSGRVVEGIWIEGPSPGVPQVVHGATPEGDTFLMYTTEAGASLVAPPLQPDTPDLIASFTYDLLGNHMLTPLFVGDVDADGHDDIAFTEDGSEVILLPGPASISRLAEDEQLLRFQTIGKWDKFSDIEMGDFDQDGHRDLLLGNYGRGAWIHRLTELPPVSWKEQP